MIQQACNYKIMEKMYKIMIIVLVTNFKPLYGNYE